MAMRQGRRHRDLPLALVFLPLLTGIVLTPIMWSIVSESTAAPIVAVSSASPGGEVQLDCRAEQTALEALDQVHPFDASAPLPSATPLVRLKSLWDWQQVLIMLRLRCIDLLRADTLDDLPQRSAKLDQLIVAWEADKSVEEVNQMIAIANGRRDWWTGLEKVRLAATRARDAAAANDYAACLAACDEIDATIVPLRGLEGFDDVFGEPVQTSIQLRPWATVMARVTREYEVLPANLTARELELDRFVRQYAADQPPGRELRDSGRSDGAALWDRAELELAMLSIDLDFGPQPTAIAPDANSSASQPAVGRLTAEPLSKRLEAANELRRRFPRAEVALRLRSHLGMWMRAALAERPQPLPDLDPNLQETVSIETSGVALGIYDPIPGRPGTWRYWRSAKERTERPDNPDHIVSTSRDQSGAKAIVAEPTSPFIISATNRYNDSARSLTQRGAMLVEDNWLAHVKRCEELVRSSAEMRSRVRNHGLAGGNKKDEQLDVANAYLSLDFRQELLLAQDILTAFPHLVELARPVEVATP